MDLLVLAPRMIVGPPGLLRKQPLIFPASRPYHSASLLCQARPAGAAGRCRLLLLLTVCDPCQQLRNG